MTPGSTFGDYKVVRLLGKGGMGEVWLLEGKSGRQVAAKILEATADHEARKRFLREAQLALGVKHPNLVETYDVGEDPDSGLCYILMEYVPGGTLADYIKANGALAIEDAVAVVEAIAGVLELGRQKGIVHRDIKPANIMFDAEGTPKLADLGIARAGNAGTETTTVTQTGVIIGTPAYMSPEQMLDSHNVDTRADIYSLGVVFFEMLTGERPNKDDTIVQLMAKAVKGEPLPDVRTLRPEVSASLAQLLSMMVAPDKDGRISTPGQITSALAIIERGGEFVDATSSSRHVGEASLPRQNKDVSVRFRRGEKIASTGARQDASPTGRGRSPSAPDSSPAGRAVAPRPPDSSPAGFPKWIVPVLVLAALAGAFILFSPRGKSVGPSSVGSRVPRGSDASSVRFATGEKANVAEKTAAVRREQVDDAVCAGTSPASPLKADQRVRVAKVGDSVWYYTLEGDSAVIGRARSMGGGGTVSAAVPIPIGRASIPSVLDGHPVVAIGALAFAKCPDLEAVKIPEGVARIDANAFCECELLEEVEFPGNLRHLAVRAFYRCPSLHLVDLGSCADFSAGSFCECRNLESVRTTARAFRTVDGALYSDDGRRLAFWPRTRTEAVVPDGVVTIGRSAFECGVVQNVKLPDSVVEIGPLAFANCQRLKGISLGKGVERVDNYAFAWCPQLRQIMFPAALHRMGTDLFVNAWSLRTVAFQGDAPDFDHRRGSSPFGDLADKMQILVRSGTAGWQKADGTYPSRWPHEKMADSRPMRAVADSEMRRLLAEGIDGVGVVRTAIVDGRRWNYRLKSRDAAARSPVVACAEITACETDGAMPAPAIDPATEGAIRVPTSVDGHPVVAIGSAAFTGCCRLTEVTLPEGVVEINGRDVFFGCTALRRISMPSTLWIVSAHGLLVGCRSLEEICFCRREPPSTPNAAHQSLNRSMFHGVSSNLVVRVPADGANWCERWPDGFSSGGRVVRNLRPVGSKAVNPALRRAKEVDRRVRVARVGDCEWSYTLEDADAVIWRGENGYNNETRPAIRPAPKGHVTAPSRLDGHPVKAIGSLAFFRCSEMTSLTVSEGIERIDGWAFLGCRSLRDVRFDGDAPDLFDQAGRQRRLDVLKGTSNDLVVHVKRGTRGWNPDGDGLPDRWPVGAGENARKIRYVDDTGAREGTGTAGVAGGAKVSAREERRIDAALLADRDPTRAVQKTLDALFPGWKTSVVGESGRPGYWAERDGERNVLCTHPPQIGVPVTLSKTIAVSGKQPLLHVKISNNESGSQFRLRVRVNGKDQREKDIKDGWTDVYVGLGPWRGKNVKLELDHMPTGWQREWAFWSAIEIVDDPNLVELERLQSEEKPVKLYERAKIEGTNPRKKVQRTCDVLFPGWKVSKNGHLDETGYEEEFANRYNNLLTHPPREDEPVVLSRRLTVPRKNPKLFVSTANHPNGDFELQIKVDGKTIARPDIMGEGWKDLEFDLSPWAGRPAKIELVHMPTGWQQEWAHWNRIEVK